MNGSGMIRMYLIFAAIVIAVVVIFSLGFEVISAARCKKLSERMGGRPTMMDAGICWIELKPGFFVREGDLPRYINFLEDSDG